MAIVTIHNIDEDLMRLLRIRAARHGRSTEDEVCDILGNALSGESAPAQSWLRAVRAGLEPGGVDLEILPREPMREPPDFG